MKIHTVIIDDESSGVRSLELMLENFPDEVKLVATTTDPVEGVKIINYHRPHLVFLDINMPGLDGFELLKKIEFTHFHLVFSTAYHQYALRALKLNACDYLLKPIDLEELKITIQKVKDKMLQSTLLPEMLTVMEKFFKMKNLRIPIPTKKNIEYVKPDQVMYIEALSTYSLVTFASGAYEKVKHGLKEYESMLCNDWLYFMRIHKSYIINLHYVSRYLKEDGGYAVMQDKKAIPVSALKKEEFFRQLNLSPTYL